MTTKRESADGSGKRNATDFTTDKAVEIYERKFKEEFERLHKGKFAVIDVLSEEAYVHESSAGAYQEARRDAPLGLFYLLRVGFVQTVSP